MNKILCPIDFTDTSLNALAYAFEMARHLKSELILFHAVHPAFPDSIPGIFMQDPVQQREEARDRLESICQKLIRKNTGHGISYYFIVRFGFAADQILQLIRDKEVDLLIMGSHGLHGSGRLFSSLPADLSVSASCPVLIIPEGCRFTDIHHLVCATNMNRYELSRIRFMVTLARVFQAHILFVHIRTHREDAIEPLVTCGMKLLDECRYQNMSFHMIDEDSVSEGIQAFARHYQAGMIVMQTSGYSFLKHLFSRNNVQQDASVTHIPLLIMHAETRGIHSRHILFSLSATS